MHDVPNLHIQGKLLPSGVGKGSTVTGIGLEIFKLFCPAMLMFRVSLFAVLLISLSFRQGKITSTMLRRLLALFTRILTRILGSISTTNYTVSP